MAYFNELPNISTVSLLKDKSRSDERILVKNIFRRAKLRTDVDKAITAYDFYVIKEGERPDILANKFYDDPELDWVILIVNNITSIRDEWPLSNNDLNTHMIDKYGSESALAEVHHYETREIRDQYNRTVLEAGLEVDQNFVFSYTPIGGVTQDISAAGPVSNYEYERTVNDAKRVIRILKEEYVGGLVSDMRSMMKYESSSQFLDRTTKETYNPKDFGI
tara:strand:- start:99 stop:758 length:660 start_codon:yes stop_codon:yes gene_type:complete